MIFFFFKKLFERRKMDYDRLSEFGPLVYARKIAKYIMVISRWYMFYELRIMYLNALLRTAVKDSLKDHKLNNKD